jgi:sugar/nucleoside kinase (ribokinase family)
MSARSGIIAGGNWIVDHVKTIDAWPPQDALANIIGEIRGNGGSPYNLLKDLAKLGATFPLEAVGLVGDDADGRYILADCEAHGINRTQLHISREAPTSYTDVMTVESGGRRTFFHRRGANAKLGPEHFDFASSRATHCHIGYALLLDRLDAHDSTGMPALSEVLRRAQKTGMTTSLDCVSENSGRFDSVVRRLLPAVDLLFVNDFEAEKLTNLDLGRGPKLNPKAVESAGRSLLQSGVRQAVVIHFPEGACACLRDGAILWQPSVNIPRELIAGTAGAGDAFAAGVLFTRLTAGTWIEALTLGVCAAASCLLHPTCSDRVMPAPACLELYRAYGFGVLKRNR